MDAIGECLPPNYSYDSKITVSNSTTFSIKEVVDEDSAKVWLKEFGDINNVTWRILRTFPNSGRINIYKIALRCQHYTDRRTKHVRTTKNTNCPAELTLTVRRVKKKSKVKNIDSTIVDFPTFVILKNQHNHAFITAAVLKYRDLSDEVKHKFVELFRKGHTPSSALYLHKIDLMLEYGEKYYKIAADGKFLPSASIVQKLFEKEFTSEYGAINGENMFEHLQSSLELYEANSGGKAKFQVCDNGENYFIVLCTPIMLRVHEKLVQSSELVMVDASGGVDKQRHRIYFFVTPSAAGGLPLGVIITDTEKETVFSQALKSFQTLVGDSAFYSKKYPVVFLTDNDLKEIKALEENFPESVKLLCHFHVLKAFWNWLVNPNHKIKKDQRQEAYFLFKKLLYSGNEDMANENLTCMCSFALENSYYNLATHIQRLWETKESWLACYRSHLPIRGNNTTNYVEIVFRILKDCILDRVMAFNLMQLVDFILTRYEMYLKQRLIDFCNGRHSNSVVKKILPTIPTPFFVFNVNLDVDTNLYHVTNIKTKCIYVVDLVRGVCSCPFGSSGKLCKHASAVILGLETEINTSYNLLCDSVKQDIFFIAEGISPLPQWFLPLTKNPTEEYPDSIMINNKEPINNIRTVERKEQSYRGVTDSSDGSTSVTLSNKEHQQIKDIFTRIEDGLKSNPTVFVPAAKKMLSNSNLFSTECGLVSAMYTFGTYSGIKPKGITIKKQRRCHKLKIGVQPTALGRRKHSIMGKRKLSAGRPSNQVKKQAQLKDHNYTSFGSLPSRKRKAPHNLEQCVYDNKSIGGIKRAK